MIITDRCLNAFMQIQADVAAVLVDKMEIVTLDLFTCLLPLFTSLLNSNIDRYCFACWGFLAKVESYMFPRGLEVSESRIITILLIITFIDVIQVKDREQH